MNMMPANLDFFIGMGTIFLTGLATGFTVCLFWIKPERRRNNEETKNNSQRNCRGV